MTKVIEKDKYRERLLDEMSQSENDTDNIIRKHVTAIVALCISYRGKDFTFNKDKNINKKVDAIIETISSEIYNKVYGRVKNTYKIVLEKEKSNINIPIEKFFNLEIYGKTYMDRLDGYLSNFKSELESYIAIGLSKNYIVSKIVDLWIRNKKKPFDEQLIKNNIGKFSAKFLQKYVYLGKGYVSSSFVGIKTLEMNTIFQSYNYVLEKIWEKNGVKYWKTIRGSNYPCEYCDEQVGKIHSIDSPFYGYHNRCYCIMLACDKFGNLI